MVATGAGRAAGWAALAVAGAANVSGYAFDLYVRWAWFDRVLHAYTLFALTLWLGVCVFGRVLDGRHRVLAAVLLAGFGVGLGGIWEIAEWGYDLVVPGDAIKGKYDTIMDLVMDTAGSVVAGVVALRFLRDGR